MDALLFIWKLLKFHVIALPWHLSRPLPALALPPKLQAPNFCPGISCACGYCDPPGQGVWGVERMLLTVPCEGPTGTRSAYRAFPVLTGHVQHHCQESRPGRTAA